MKFEHVILNLIVRICKFLTSIIDWIFRILALLENLFSSFMLSYKNIYNFDFDLCFTSIHNFPVYEKTNDHIVFDDNVI